MKPQPITHLLTDTVSSDPDYNGDCDLCLVPLSAKYVSYLLNWMDEVARLCRRDKNVYSIRCWDGMPGYFRLNDKLEQLHDINGNPVDASLDKPVLLAADPQFAERDGQRVECKAIQISNDSLWWTAHVKHTGIRIESAWIGKEILLQVQQSFGSVQVTKPTKAPVHPVLQQLHDLLYLDIRQGKEFYNPDNPWDANTIAAVAEIVAKHIPRPAQRRKTHARKKA